MCCSFRLLRNSHRVGSDVGDKTYRALSFDFHALVKLLSYHHGSFGGKAYLICSVLLQAACCERSKRLSCSFFSYNLGNRIFSPFKGCFDLLCLLSVLNGELFSVLFCQSGSKGFSLLEHCIYVPVFLGYKALYKVFPVAYYFKSCRLNSACRKSSADFSPKERAYLVAHQSVQHSPCLLCVHQLKVNGARVFYRILYGVLCNFVKHNSARFIGINAQKISKMP